MRVFSIFNSIDFEFLVASVIDIWRHSDKCRRVILCGDVFDDDGLRNCEENVDEMEPPPPLPPLELFWYVFMGSMSGDKYFYLGKNWFLLSFR